MNFIFSCQKYFTHSLRSFVKYCSYHSKIKFISLRRRVTNRNKITNKRRKRKKLMVLVEVCGGQRSLAVLFAFETEDGCGSSQTYISNLKPCVVI